MGNKFSEHDFLAQIATSDIIGISETHIYDEVLNELDIANFTRMGYKNRSKMKKVNKTSGGIAIFAKHEIANIAEICESKNNDLVWIKIKKQFCNYPKDIYIGSVYLSDENGRKNIAEKIRKLGEAVSYTHLTLPTKA